MDCTLEVSPKASTAQVNNVPGIYIYNIRMYVRRYNAVFSKKNIQKRLPLCPEALEPFVY